MYRFLGGASSYPVAVFTSVSLHVLLMLFIFGNWQVEEPKRKVIKPRFVEATLLQLESKPREQPKPQPRPQPKPKPQPEPKPKPKVDDAAKKKAEAERKKKAEAERQRKLADEQKRKAAEEQKRQEEAARQAEEERRQQELQRVLQQEQLAAQQAEEEQLVASYSYYVADRIANNWSRPLSSRRDMKCELLIQLTPNGQLVSVAISKSSGNEAFDRSAEQAVRKVDRFERLRELDPGVFERNFRNLHLVFSPDDLRL